MDDSVKQLEDIISKAFTAGLCYGAALAICQNNYSEETVMNMAKYLLHDVEPNILREGV